MFKADVLCEKNARHGSWGSGQSENDDWCRLLAGIAGVLLRSKASWGKEKIRPIRRIQTPKKKKEPSSTHESKFTNELESRSEADVQSTGCCACTCSACLV